MKIKLLEIGSKTEQLSVCRLSLLLGVLTDENRISEFLKFACGMLQMDKGILVFKEEPYGWHMENGVCHAFLAKPHDEFEFFFLDQPYIDHRHPNYKIVSDYNTIRGVDHKRYVAISLKNENVSIGHVVLFDDREEAFDPKQLNIVLEFVQSLVNIIKLRLKNEELKEMYEQQSALNFSKTKFFQIIAHDLRAPFHGLIGFSEVLSQERATLKETDIQDISDYLHETAQSTYNLLESLLTWAMAEGGRFVYHPINFDLKQSANIVVDVLTGLAIKKNIEILNEVTPNTMVFADINMVTSVIQNLVSNALKFTHTDGSGKVILKAEQTDQFVHIYIQDTGLGMTREQIKTLFEPKLTVSVKGTSGEKGMGLGLVLCKRFIDLNQGEIAVISKEGQGSIFKVTLPRVKEVQPIQFKNLKQQQTA